MDVVVKGHHVTVTEGFRSYVVEKISRLEKLDQRVIRVEVKVSDDNSRSAPDGNCRVEVTVLSKGPTVRAEAVAEDKQPGFDIALDRLMSQLRKASDRKKVHRGNRTPATVRGAIPINDVVPSAENADTAEIRNVAGVTVEGDGPMLVREKIHAAPPMHLEQALYEMELVGHDFFLFVEADSLRPSVVYRRKGYDYGVIHLDTAEEIEVAS